MSELEELRELAKKASRMLIGLTDYISVQEGARVIIDKYKPKPDSFAKPLSEYLEWWESNHENDKPESSLDKFHEFFDHLIQPQSQIVDKSHEIKFKDEWEDNEQPQSGENKT